MDSAAINDMSDKLTKKINDATEKLRNAQSGNGKAVNEDDKANEGAAEMANIPRNQGPDITKADKTTEGIETSMDNGIKHSQYDSLI